MESSAHSLSQNRDLSAGNNTVPQEGAKDNRCLLEVLGALSASIKDVDFFLKPANICESLIEYSVGTMMNGV